MRCLILFVLLLAASVQAGVPQLLNFQGRLTDDLGAPLDTTIAIDFAIFDDTAGTSELWAETHPSVVVQGGIFQVLLGSIKAFKETVFDGSVRYIGMAVDGKMSDTLIPIVSVAYAMSAAQTDTAAYAVHARRADTATVALSGGGGSGGGWVDEGSFVTLIDPNDSVAIGTDDPEYPLDVEGPLNAIRGRSTGTGLAVGVTGINSTTGIGVLGYSVGGHSVYGLGGGGKAGWFQGDMYCYGTLGLNIENPEERLHIYDASSGGRAFMKIQSAHPSNWGEAGLRIETPQNRWHWRMDDDLNEQVPIGGLGLRSQNANKEVMTWTLDGYVGINNRLPEYTLDVHSGETTIRGLTTGGVQSSGVYGYATSDGVGVTGSSDNGTGIFGISTTGYAGYFVGPKTYVSGDLGVGASNPTHKLTVNGSFGLQSSGTTKFHMGYYNGGLTISETSVADYRINIEEGGNVGIGTGSPQEKLHVAGNARVDGILTATDLYSTSITDEAGVAANMVGFGNFTEIVGDVRNIISAQIDVPGPGVVVAMVTTSIDIDHSYNDQDNTVFGLSRTSGTIDDDHRVYLFMSSNVGTGDYELPLSASGVFQVWSEGAVTVYFAGYRSHGDAFVRAWNSHLTLMYFPTTYGSVVTASANSNGDQSDVLGVPERDFDSSPKANSEIDVLRAEVEQLRREIEAMKK